MKEPAAGEARTSRTRPDEVQAGGILRILGYHRITDPDRTPRLEPSLVSATPKVFRRQMLHLLRRYEVVSLEEVLTAFRGGRPLPRRSVLLTFDDAYRDFKEEAWPILRELGLPATLFVPTAYPGRPDRAFWWDRLHRILGGDGPEPRIEPSPLGGEGLRSLPPDTRSDIAGVRGLMKRLSHEEVEDVLEELTRSLPSATMSADSPAVLDWDELRELAEDGVALGAHTRWHPALTRTSEDRIREELSASLADLREEIGEVPAVVSYPYGFHNDRVVRIAEEEGFELGFTCLDGLNQVGETNPLRLYRTVVTRKTTPLVFRIRMLPWFAAVDRWRHRAEESTATEERPTPEAVRAGLARLVVGTQVGTS